MSVKTLFKTLLVLLTVFTANPLLAEMTIVVQNQEHQVLKDVVIEVVNSNNSELDEQKSKVAIMDQINKTFVPHLLVITKGQAVDFPNSDNIRHHVYSFSQAKIFELKLYADKPEKPITFENHGVVVLGCNIHDSMLGYIYVADSSQTYVTDDTGSVKLPSLAMDTKINLWYEQQKQGPEYLNHTELSKLTQDQNGNLLVTIETVPPQKRDSFEDVFGGSN